MAINTTIESLSTNPALNGPDGTVDPPSSIDDGMRYLGSFIAQLRDGLATPVGSIQYYPFDAAPAGWIKLNGALISRTTYAKVLALAQTDGLVSEADWAASMWGRFSVGDGITTIRLPDTRGMFIRGLDESRGIDAGRVRGSNQEPSNQAHGHGLTDPSHVHTTDLQGQHHHDYTSVSVAGSIVATPGVIQILAASGAVTGDAGVHNHNVTGSVTGISIQSQGGEARPRNLAYPLIMKF